MSNTRKTRIFRLVDRETSGTTGSRYPITESTLPKHIIVTEEGEKEIAWLSGRPSVYVDEWKGFEGSVFDNSNGLSFRKPTFKKGYLEVSPDETLLAHFLSLSPQNKNSKYAGQKGIRIQFEEVVEAEEKKEEAKALRQRAKLDGYIFDLDESKLHSIAMIYGIRIKDVDGENRSEDAIAVDLINSIASSTQETISEFLKNVGQQDFEVKTIIADAFVNGVLQYDSMSGNVNFVGGSPIYKVSDKSNYILDIYLWAKSTDEGKNMLKTVYDRLNVRQDDKSFEIVEKTNAAVAATGLMELKGMNLFQEAKHAKVIKWDTDNKDFRKLSGGGRYIKIKDINGEIVTKKDQLFELIDNDEEFKEEIVNKIALFKSDK